MDHIWSGNLANLLFLNKTENSKIFFLCLTDINSKYTVTVPLQHSLLTIKKVDIK